MEILRQSSGTVIISGFIENRNDVSILVEELNRAIRRGFKVQLFVDSKALNSKTLEDAIFKIHTS